jgi:heme/copper-type cytochrome/quinol oxidase subunit 2
MKRPLSDWEGAVEKQKQEEKVENLLEVFIALIKFSVFLVVLFVVVHFVIKFW